ncbi:MAG TPA: L,D-transpeptidase family protein [Gammaproteobacteria bacterium]|nr:L,D-transpeptidase family protein [Gammaproteobacteria bacterium]
MTKTGLALGVVLFCFAAPRGWSAAAGDATPSYIAHVLAKAHHAYGSSQVIVVTVGAPDKPRASLAAYAFENGHWKRATGKIAAVVGRRGITLDKHEGDLKSPAGIFYLGRAFGSGPKPDGVDMPYTRTTKNDYWIDDTTSPDYNKWVRYAGDPDARWKSYERLRVPAYQYMIVIRYNMHPIRKDRGSAIFFHIWPGPDGSTVGCTAISKALLVDLLKWLEPDKRPVIIQGTVAQLKTIARH